MTTMTSTPTSTNPLRTAAHRGDGFLVPAGTTSTRRKRTTFTTVPTGGRHLITSHVSAASAVIALGASSVTAVALMIGLGR
ncbi:hypothetical protein [Frondihabitans sp. VKM Ac-2883]|uniref:hypothetical protein n=1 Tax=Frondihabitans sp. VKM Ac-2883 TaxID=2783823 RepID=UPI00188CE6BF|nr:hypothetical protein [Frondihabitans sp. VKM Ac-2883]MBF4577924.1 hypothetical protein [Frondihabitans sp. VKM Ac-2883]